MMCSNITLLMSNWNTCVGLRVMLTKGASVKKLPFPHGLACEPNNGRVELAKNSKYPAELLSGGFDAVCIYSLS